jgi:hypothetical protein
MPRRHSEHRRYMHNNIASRVILSTHIPGLRLHAYYVLMRYGHTLAYHGALAAHCVPESAVITWRRPRHAAT